MPLFFVTVSGSISGVMDLQAGTPGERVCCVTQNMQLQSTWHSAQVSSGCQGPASPPGAVPGHVPRAQSSSVFMTGSLQAAPHILRHPDEATAKAGQPLLYACKHLVFLPRESSTIITIKQNLQKPSAPPSYHWSLLPVNSPTRQLCGLSC